MMNNKDIKNYLLSDKNLLSDLVKVKKFLNNNPLSTIIEVNAKTDVSLGKILIFIKNGFIKIRQDNNTFIKKN